MTHPQYGSVHGGHSGQFCHHAQDTLEDIVKTYIRYGYSWVGITEHAPGISEDLLYPDEREAGFTPEFLLEQFGDYMTECRRLQKKYADRITLFSALEIETYSGYDTFIPDLVKQFKPDYLVGSLHFVDDMGFDYSRAQYEHTAEAVGGLDRMYCRYFDLQFEMITCLSPAVVGHFDLIRIFDPDYRNRLEKAEIRKRIVRNLELIKELDLIMDFNLRSLAKGADEPYITDSILRLAREMDIAVVPGDDSHGIADIHRSMDIGVAKLEKFGFTLDWPRPKLSCHQP